MAHRGGNCGAECVAADRDRNGTVTQSPFCCLSKPPQACRGCLGLIGRARSRNKRLRADDLSLGANWDALRTAHPALGCPESYHTEWLLQARNGAWSNGQYFFRLGLPIQRTG